MSGEPRKASQVLLDLEAKIDNLINTIKTIDFNQKVLSNKLNDAMALLKNQPATQPKVMVEAVNTLPPQAQFVPARTPDPERRIPIKAESNLPMTDTPQGFRRTSRPETYAGDDTYLPQEIKFPMQVPQQPQPPAEVIVPQQPAKATPKKAEKQQKTVVQNAIPTMQRVVDGQGKSLFLADVEVMDLSNAQPAFKTRTNGTGKWMASLAVGTYRVTVRKMGDSVSKTPLVGTQDIKVDGSQSPLDLPVMIIKPKEQ